MRLGQKIESQREGRIPVELRVICSEAAVERVCGVVRASLGRGLELADNPVEDVESAGVCMHVMRVLLSGLDEELASCILQVPMQHPGEALLQKNRADSQQHPLDET